MSYREWQPANMPPPHVGRYGAALQGELGGIKDDTLARARDAVLAGMPHAGPADALKPLGDDALLPRGLNETDGAYAERIRTAHTAHADRGRHFGLLTQLRIAGYTGVYIIQHNGRYSTLDGAGALVIGETMVYVNRPDLDGVLRSRPGASFDWRDHFWSNFGLFVPVYSSIYGSAGGPSAAQSMVNTIVARWAPAKSVFCGTRILTSGSSPWDWPFSSVWGTSDGNYGDETVLYIPPDGGPAVTLT